MKKILIFLALCFPVLAVKIDSEASSFQDKVMKHRVDVYDFKGDYPQLEKVDIDGRRKKSVELYLSGNYPLLRKVSYEGGFGTLLGDLTGDFPELTQVEILCGNANMDLDLRGHWYKSCRFDIRGLKENVTIQLPKDVGLVINTHTKIKGKVIAPKELLHKQGRFHILNKTYKNDLSESAEVVLTLHVETTEGLIILEIE